MTVIFLLSFSESSGGIDSGRGGLTADLKALHLGLQMPAGR
jgi:hypothetical protein